MAEDPAVEALAQARQRDNGEWRVTIGDRVCLNTWDEANAKEHASALNRFIAAALAARTPTQDRTWDCGDPPCDACVRCLRHALDQAHRKLEAHTPTTVETDNDFLRQVLREEGDGTPKRIIGAMFDVAEELGHPKYSARHALPFLIKLAREARTPTTSAQDPK